MEVTTIKLGKGWNGTGYIVLSGGMEFLTHQEWRFKNGLISGDSFALLFNEATEVEKDTLLKVAELLLAAEEVKKTQKVSKDEPVVFELGGKKP